jgi:hypothetical protein
MNLSLPCGGLVGEILTLIKREGSNNEFRKSLASGSDCKCGTPPSESNDGQYWLFKWSEDDGTRRMSWALDELKI